MKEEPVASPEQPNSEVKIAAKLVAPARAPQRKHYREWKKNA
jgi:hypothetical protein